MFEAAAGLILPGLPAWKAVQADSGSGGKLMHFSCQTVGKDFYRACVAGTGGA
ncbi:hypothetical protein GCM10027343_30260 [Noviherbaspirillum agri]